MKKTLGVDPGSRWVGLAYFEDGILKDTGWVANPERHTRDVVSWRAMTHEVGGFVCEKGWEPIDEVILERQQVFKSYEMRVNPDDILQVTGVVGGLSAWLESNLFYSYLPREWKKNTKKEVFTEYIVSMLREDELALVSNLKGRQRSDVLDACGIARYHLGRFRATTK